MSTALRGRSLQDPLPTSAPAGGERLAAFSFLWAVAALFQVSSTLWWARNLSPLTVNGLAETAVIATAFALVLRPASVRRLLFLALAQVASTLVALPTVPNHRLIASFVNLTILVAFAGVAWKDRTVPGVRLLAAFAPAVRLETLLVYGFAGLAKLNRDYFDPAVSCATDFYLDIQGVFPFLPASDWAQGSAIYASAALELGIALLLVTRLRRVGIAAGLFFHFFLALHPERHFFDFSSTMFALLFLFTSPGLLETVRKVGPLPRIRVVQAIAVGGFGLVLLTSLGWNDPGWPPWFLLGRYVLWLPYGAGLIGLYLLALRRPDPASGPHRFKPSGVGVTLVAAAVVANGLLPYVGLKTRSSFDMYSNLAVEGEGSNHLLVPDFLDRFSYQEDLVTVLASSDSILQEQHADAGFLMTFFEFRSHTAAHPDLSVTYLRDGQRRTVRRAAEDPELSAPHPWPLRKLLWFRPVDSGDRARCQW
jgi:hypothetical protein